MNKIAAVLILVLIPVFVFAEDTPVEGKFSPLTFIRGDTAYITIYAQLSGDDVLLWKDFQIIESMPQVKKIKVFMDCLGGSATTGFAVADLFSFMQKSYDVSIEAYGTVASAAIIVFASIDNRVASQNTAFLVHQARIEPDRTMTASNIKLMDALFDQMKNSYLDLLSARAVGIDRNTWEEMLDEETWFTTAQAVEYGLVKEIR
jgi:ATP-dependent protease ClpP protease subunit